MFYYCKARKQPGAFKGLSGGFSQSFYLSFSAPDNICIIANGARRGDKALDLLYANVKNTYKVASIHPACRAFVLKTTLLFTETGVSLGL